MVPKRFDSRGIPSDIEDSELCSSDDDSDLRINRVKGVSMPSDKEMKQNGRGSFEEKVATLDGIQLACTRWQDNKVVTLLSTFVGAEPVLTAPRRTQKEERRDIPKNVGARNVTGAFVSPCQMQGPAGGTSCRLLAKSRLLRNQTTSDAAA
ncbi:hypothetical protein HPB47_002205 [Ixodes persulcatus]|uniref:Uncharacterized protein n=1 Tax=Ixodes persulcatus TaxID=34615 RepID=A0AC60PLW0_IXOPE|nr:hypothetical protein HPB47_002205 [Ixodes persulcatus]